MSLFTCWDSVHAFYCECKLNRIVGKVVCVRVGLIIEIEPLKCPVVWVATMLDFKVCASLSLGLYLQLHNV